VGLFDGQTAPAQAPDAPLADRMRPRDLDEFAGQAHVVGPGTALRRAIERDELRSIILWGPPGCGKTSLARIIARRTRADFVPFSAVLCGIKEVREVMDRAALARRTTGRRTILFVDEIHRFNKAQQDAFLPHVESGTVVLVGATTENPSFEVISALLSRSRVCRLERLDEDALVRLLRRALDDEERGLGRLRLEAPEDALRLIAARSQGDARAALNVLELASRSAPAGPDGRPHLTREILADAFQCRAAYFDKAGEEHFNLISALHKSMRSSDADATLYWLGRLLAGGEDPLYVARRVVRCASEDVGLADPQALVLAIAAKEAVHFVGLPEGELALAQAAVYCALAPKSDALYRAAGEVREAIAGGADDPVPMALRNAPTDLMQREGYGRGYRHAHECPDAVTDLECLPARLGGRRFYRPGPRGLEAELAQRIARWLHARAGRGGPAPPGGEGEPGPS
jgi:putative ATPase